MCARECVCVCVCVVGEGRAEGEQTIRVGDCVSTVSNASFFATYSRRLRVCGGKLNGFLSNRKNKQQKKKKLLNFRH